MAATQLVTALGPDAPDDGPDGRQQRGLAIAAAVPIQKHRLGYKVPSQSGNGHYIVNIDDDPICTCPDYELRQLPCKHIIATQFTARREEGGTGTNEQNDKTVDEIEEVEKTPMRPTYGQNWRLYDAAQEQEHVEVLLRDLCDLARQPDYQFGRPRLPVSDMVYCIGLKTYNGMSRRRTMTAVRRAHERGLLDCTPSNASITRYLDDPSLTGLLKYLVEQSALPLKAVETHFAIDSSGFGTTTYDRWFDHKHGKQKSKARYVKAHLTCGVKTNVVTAVDVSDAGANDSPSCSRSYGRPPSTLRRRELSADKAYLSKGNFEGAHELGTDLYVPFKSNSVFKDPKRRRSGAWERAFHYYQYNREEFLQHYHLRSNVESTMDMIKAKFGPALRTKVQAAQFNEVLGKVLVHNLSVLVRSMYELGIEPQFQSWLSESGPRDGDGGPALAVAA